MTEQTLVWVRRSPARPAAPELDEQLLAAGLSEACAGCGFELEEFIAARGSFGSWLARLARQGRSHRVIWNGKEGLLVLEGPGRDAGWTELASTTPGSRDIDGLLAGVRGLLADPATGHAAAGHGQDAGPVGAG